ncbi:putative head morphogenesis protein SPP1 gp7 [Allomeiothermus silvanus DSM 9946]|uniref:Head morphogenesis protein SPP1 gp7 n=1 Tax=Allomeiothermus silvanus (strain ATCC 700542 / DSM 9946 / NBRC 106475 / NCIMB 13440 / VI-R2) TaxID=526227 RepID=D7BGH2_ALLS1|nr:PBECR2 nuclease fold domain-containing protein [Allomeiothermus silvanus]ADH63788.1 putative head morphogenesis protein SPP1 gp7 [Allomeiothermus silvanus DSM 9946]
MAWNVDADPLQPAEATDWFRRKLNLRKDEYRQLTDRARRRAFTVAGVASLDLLAEVHRSLLEALVQGTPYQAWAQNLGPTLAAAWGTTNGYRLKLVFQQNILSAYAAGRYAQLTDPEVLRARPYWMFDAVLDSATTETCRQLNGVVLPHDHPLWAKNYPPRHFACRSGIRSLTVREAQERGITENPPEVQAEAGFGLRSDPSEWGRDWARGVATSASSARWQPAFAGTPPDWRTYGRPEAIPRDRLPPDLLVPSISEVGEAGFRRALARAWGGLEVVVADPTGAGTILNARVLLEHLSREPPDDRERYYGLLPDVVANPYEIWLVPLQSDRGAVAFRKYYLKLYGDKERAFLLVVEQQRGSTWTAYTHIYSSKKRYIADRRIGFLLWGRD